MKSEAFNNALGTVDECLGQYIQERRQQIDVFIGNHFSIEEVIALQKKAVWVDLLFYPLNALWSIPYLSFKKSIEFLNKVGWTRFNEALEVVPSRIKTGYQRQIERRIKEELLAPESLMRLLQENQVLQGHLSVDEWRHLEVKIEREISSEIESFTASQVLISDLTSSIMTLFAGRVFFGDGSLDIFGMGSRLAQKLAYNSAVDDFVFGKGVGSVFYQIVPVHPTKTQIFLATIGIGFLLTCFSLVTGLLGDPLRKQLGLHNKKFNSLLDSLEGRLFLVVKNTLKKS